MLSLVTNSVRAVDPVINVTHVPNVTTAIFDTIDQVGKLCTDNFMALNYLFQKLTRFYLTFD